MSAQPTTNRVEYATYSDFSEVAGISSAWDRLLDASTCNRAFGSAEWYAASCRAAPGMDPWVLAAIRDGQIAAILPLAIDPEGKVARFPHFACDYNDVVARSDDSAVVADLLDYAVGACLGKRILLSRLRPDSNCVRALPLLPSRRHLGCYLREIDWHYRIALPSSFDDYLASRSKAFRTNVKQALRRMEAADLAVRELLPSDFDPAELPAVLTAMACARQKDVSLFMEPEARKFVGEAFPGVFRKRGLIAHVVLQGVRAVGLYIHMVGGASLGAWNGGFLPEVARWSPGTLLLANGIKRAIDLGLPEYDFLEGGEVYKRNWADDRYAIYEVELVSGAQQREPEGRTTYVAAE